MHKIIIPNSRVISGTYDYENGDWNNEYIVTDLLETGSMIWTVKDDKSDVCRYVRCEKVPDDVIAEGQPDSEE